MTETKPVENRTGTQTLERGLDLLERIVDQPMNARDLAKSSGLALHTTRRLATSLVTRGFLSSAPDGRYLPGPKIIHLGSRAQNHLNFVDVAREHLKLLSSETGIVSYLGERAGDYSIHLHRAPGTQRVVVSTPVGTRRKLPETSLGMALMLDDGEAEWDRILAETDIEALAANWKDAMHAAKTNGYVVRVSPPPDDLRAMAAPIRDASGRIVAAISLVTAAQYADDAALVRIGPMVRATADTISTVLGYVE